MVLELRTLQSKTKQKTLNKALNNKATADKERERPLMHIRPSSSLRQPQLSLHLYKKVYVLQLINNNQTS